VSPIVRNDRPAGRVACCVLLCLFGAVLSAGSAQARSTVKGTWQEGVTRNQTFTRVLVVGVSPNVNQRCAFEFFMASQLQSESVQVIRSCDAVKEKNPLTLESIVQAVSAANADAVLATSLVAREIAMKEGGSRDTRGNASYKATDAGFATGYYGVYGVPVIYGEFATAPAFTIAQGKAEVSSRFYRTSDKALLYTLDTTATKLESSDAALHDFAAAIADKLRREGLTR
jgi:altronate dehydratase